MAVKLGTLLLRNAVIGLDHLEAALRSQVLYGGKLGTNLVEIGAIDIDSLSKTLAELTGLPAATPEMLEAADPNALALLDPETASELGAVPMHRTSDGVAVAVIDPDDAKGLAELSARVHGRVSCHVVPELRALYYLEKLYGLPRKPRFVRTATRDAERRAAAAIADRRRSQPGGMSMPESVVVEPRRRRASTPSMANASTSSPPRSQLDSVRGRILGAKGREEIADALVAFGHGRADAVVVFLVRGGNAIGWRGHVSNSPSAVRIEDLSLPLGGISVLQAAHDSEAPYRGRAPSSGRPVEQRLWAALGTAPHPEEALVVPVSVRQRVVNLIYAHTVFGPLTDEFAGGMIELAQATESAYTRMIRAHRS